MLLKNCCLKKAWLIAFIAGMSLFCSTVEAQKINVEWKNAPMAQVFKDIEKQTGIGFVYAVEQTVKMRPVSLKAKNLELAELLDKVFAGQPFTYTRSGNDIILKEKKIASQIPQDSRQQSAMVLLKGIVTDDKNLHLKGASILLMGTTKGTETDNDGRFELNVPEKGGNLMCSYVGFEPKIIKVNRSQDLVIQLLAKQETKPEEVIVIGYGTVKKSDLTGSVSKLKTEGSEERPIATVEQLLQGRVSGVQVQSANGAPGSGFSILVRGGNSTSNNQPLYVIDGYPIDPGTGDLSSGGNNQAIASPPVNPLATLNPTEIESIEILKDASSTAIYGSRGANGVVMITTKRGKKGRDQIEVNIRRDVSKVRRTNPMLNGPTFWEYTDTALVNSGKTNDPNLSYVYNKQDSLKNLAWTDWQSKIFRWAVSNDLQFTLSGADEKNRYSLICSYANLQGVVNSSYFKKGGIRFNFDRDVSSRFKLALNLNGNQSTQRLGVNGISTGESSSSIIASALLFIPTKVPTDSIGAINQTINSNPLTLLNLVQDVYNSSIFFANAKGTYKLSDHWVANVNIGANYTQAVRQTFYPIGTYVGTGNNGYAYKNQDNRFNYLGELTVNYNRKFGSHNLNSTFGTTYQTWTTDGNSYSAFGFPSTYTLGYYGMQYAKYSSLPINSHTEYALGSFLGRVNYTLMDRYYFTVTGRDDISSRLSSGNQAAFFPSAAFKWNLLKENFLQPMKWLSTYNFRMSYGLSGNQSVAIGQTNGNLQPQRASIGNSVVIGNTMMNIANPTLGWEYTRQVNMGWEIGVLKNRFNFEVNFYKKNTRDLLINVPITTVSGVSFLTTNTGEVENKGLELELTAKILNGKFKWTASGNITFNRNKMVDMGLLGSDGTIFGPNYFSSGGLLNQPIHATELGRPIGSFFGYKTNGIYQTDDEVAKGPEAATAKPGDIKYVDVDGDGKITASDRTIIGNPNPKYIFGLNNSFEFKGFRLTVLIMGNIGNQLANMNRYRIDALTIFPANAVNITQEAWENRWKGPGTSNYYPSARASGNYLNSRFSDFLIEDGSYIRLKSVVIDREISLGRLKAVKGVRVFASATNLITITRYKGYDPEVNTNYTNPMTQGVDNGTYPQVKTYSLGLNVRI